MKNIIAILLLFIICSCSERDALPDACSQIEGSWYAAPATWNDESSCKYNFSDGSCTIRVYNGGAIISEYNYAYSCTGDSMHLINLATNGEQVAQVVFVDQDTFELHLFGWPTVTLKRLP